MTNLAPDKPGAALSAATARKVNWDKVAQEVTQQGLQASRSTESYVYPEGYPEKVTEVFQASKVAFAETLAPLRKQVQITLWIVLPALALSIAGGAILAAWKEPVSGGALTSGALAALFVFLNRAWRLGRDQAVLELVPATYETLFRLCKSPQQYEVVFEAFLDEMVTMRRNLRGGTPRLPPNRDHVAPETT